MISQPGFRVGGRLCLRLPEDPTSPEEGGGEATEGGRADTALSNPIPGPVPLGSFGGLIVSPDEATDVGGTLTAEGFGSVTAAKGTGAPPSAVTKDEKEAEEETG